MDKANIGYYDYSAVLYMTTMGVGCEGGQLVFADPDGDEVIEPRAGRCVLFASGTEHLHQVQPVSQGVRISMGMFFTLTRARGKSLEEHTRCRAASFANHAGGDPVPRKVHSNSCAVA